MTDREAMKRALEALEEINKLSIGEHAICLPAEIDGAMDALRSRLAQPEQEPVGLSCCGYADASAIKWNPYNQVVQCHNCGQTYTTPPQRKPLTDDEIEAALLSVDPMTKRLPPGMKAFARAIEAAHGIKGEA